MAASRSMLESLLARVQRRAAEPRRRSSVAPLSNAMRDVAKAVESARPAPLLVAEDDIEEYDEELIEIIDDGDVPPDSEPGSAPEIRPLELSASVPSVEMRRHVVPQGELPRAPVSTPAAQPSPVARPAVAPLAPAAATAVREPLSAEAVPRKPLMAADVVQSQGARRELRAMSFVELLDASLELGR